MKGRIHIWGAKVHPLDKYNDMKLLSKFRFLWEYVLQLTEQLRDDIKKTLIVFMLCQLGLHCRKLSLRFLVRGVSQYSAHCMFLMLTSFENSESTVNIIANLS